LTKSNYTDILDDRGTNRTPDPQHRTALAYILAAHDEAEHKRRRETFRDSLKTWIMENCEQDENGNFRWELDDPITVDGEEWITGFELQRRVSEFINEDKAWDIVRKYDVGDACVVMVEELDCDQLYVLNQQGIISDEDIDSILEQTETWALVKRRA
jgi:hypothetical protein